MVLVRTLRSRPKLCFQRIAGIPRCPLTSDRRAFANEFSPNQLRGISPECRGRELYEPSRSNDQRIWGPIIDSRQQGLQQSQISMLFCACQQRSPLWRPYSLDDHRSVQSNVLCLLISCRIGALQTSLAKLTDDRGHLISVQVARPEALLHSFRGAVILRNCAFRSRRKLNLSLLPRTEDAQRMYYVVDSRGASPGLSELLGNVSKRGRRASALPLKGQSADVRMGGSGEVGRCGERK